MKYAISATAILLANVGAFALPQGGRVEKGLGNLDNPAHIIQESQHLQTRWHSFDIAAKEQVRIQQPNAQASINIKVRNGSGATNINGTLTANGRVSLENPAGIQFGKNSVVNVGGLLASSAKGAVTSLGQVRATEVVRFQGLSSKNVINVGGNVSAQEIIVESNGDIVIGNSAHFTASKQVLIGGGFQGKDSSVLNSRTTDVKAAAQINAPYVVVWSDKVTRFLGRIDAGRGFVEVSGKQHLIFPDISRAKAGTLLLDPPTIFIDPKGHGGDSQIDDGILNADEFSSQNVGLGVPAVVNYNGNVVLGATGSITVRAGANINKSNGSLTLSANNIVINATITISGTGNYLSFVLTGTSASTPFTLGASSAFVVDDLRLDINYTNNSLFFVPTVFAAPGRNVTITAPANNGRIAFSEEFNLCQAGNTGCGDLIIDVGTVTFTNTNNAIRAKSINITVGAPQGIISNNGPLDFHAYDGDISLTANNGASIFSNANRDFSFSATTDISFKDVVVDIGTGAMTLTAGVGDPSTGIITLTGSAFTTLSKLTLEQDGAFFTRGAPYSSKGSASVEAIYAGVGTSPPITWATFTSLNSVKIDLNISDGDLLAALVGKFVAVGGILDLGNSDLTVDTVPLDVPLSITTIMTAGTISIASGVSALTSLKLTARTMTLGGTVTTNLRTNRLTLISINPIMTSSNLTIEADAHVDAPSLGSVGFDLTLVGITSAGTFTLRGEKITLNAPITKTNGSLILEANNFEINATLSVLSPFGFSNYLSFVLTGGPPPSDTPFDFGSGVDINALDLRIARNYPNIFLFYVSPKFAVPGRRLTITTPPGDRRVAFSEEFNFCLADNTGCGDLIVNAGAVYFLNSNVNRIRAASINITVGAEGITNNDSPLDLHAHNGNLVITATGGSGGKGISSDSNHNFNFSASHDVILKDVAVAIGSGTMTLTAGVAALLTGKIALTGSAFNTLGALLLSQDQFFPAIQPFLSSNAPVTATYRGVGVNPPLGWATLVYQNVTPSDIDVSDGNLAAALVGKFDVSPSGILDLGNANLTAHTKTLVVPLSILTITTTGTISITSGLNRGAMLTLTADTIVLGRTVTVGLENQLFLNSPNPITASSNLRVEAVIFMDAPSLGSPGFDLWTFTFLAFGALELLGKNITINGNGAAAPHPLTITADNDIILEGAVSASTLALEAKAGGVIFSTVDISGASRVEITQAAPYALIAPTNFSSKPILSRPIPFNRPSWGACGTNCVPSEDLSISNGDLAAALVGKFILSGSTLDLGDFNLTANTMPLDIPSNILTIMTTGKISIASGLTATAPLSLTAGTFALGGTFTAGSSPNTLTLTSVNPITASSNLTIDSPVVLFVSSLGTVGTASFGGTPGTVGSDLTLAGVTSSSTLELLGNNIRLNGEIIASNNSALTVAADNDLAVNGAITADTITLEATAGGITFASPSPLIVASTINLTQANPYNRTAPATFPVTPILNSSIPFFRPLWGSCGMNCSDSVPANLVITDGDLEAALVGKFNVSSGGTLALTTFTLTAHTVALVIPSYITTITTMGTISIASGLTASAPLSLTAGTFALGGTFTAGSSPNTLTLTSVNPITASSNLTIDSPVVLFVSSLGTVGTASFGGTPGTVGSDLTLAGVTSSSTLELLGNNIRLNGEIIASNNSALTVAADNDLAVNGAITADTITLEATAGGITFASTSTAITAPTINLTQADPYNLMAPATFPTDTDPILNSSIPFIRSFWGVCGIKCTDATPTDLVIIDGDLVTALIKKFDASSGTLDLEDFNLTANTVALDIPSHITSITTTGMISITDGSTRAAGLNLNAGGGLTIGGSWDLGLNTLDLTTGTGAIAFNNTPTITAATINLTQADPYVVNAPATFSTPPILNSPNLFNKPTAWGVCGTNCLVPTDLVISDGGLAAAIVDKFDASSGTLDLGSFNLTADTKSLDIPPSIHTITTTGTISIASGLSKGALLTLTADTMVLGGTVTVGLENQLFLNSPNPITASSNLRVEAVIFVEAPSLGSAVFDLWTFSFISSRAFELLGDDITINGTGIAPSLTIKADNDILLEGLVQAGTLVLEAKAGGVIFSTVDISGASRIEITQADPYVVSAAATFSTPPILNHLTTRFNRPSWGACGTNTNCLDPGDLVITDGALGTAIADRFDVFSGTLDLGSFNLTADTVALDIPSHIRSITTTGTISIADGLTATAALTLTAGTLSIARGLTALAAMSLNAGTLSIARGLTASAALSLNAGTMALGGTFTAGNVFTLTSNNPITTSSDLTISPSFILSAPSLGSASFDLTLAGVTSSSMIQLLGKNITLGGVVTASSSATVTAANDLAVNNTITAATLALIATAGGITFATTSTAITGSTINLTQTNPYAALLPAAFSTTPVLNSSIPFFRPFWGSCGINCSEPVPTDLFITDGDLVAAIAHKFDLSGSTLDLGSFNLTATTTPLDVPPHVRRITTTGTISITSGSSPAAALNLNADGGLTIGGSWNLGLNALTLATDTGAIAFNNNPTITASSIALTQVDAYVDAESATFSTPPVLNSATIFLRPPWGLCGTNCVEPAGGHLVITDGNLIDTLSGRFKIFRGTLDLGDFNLTAHTTTLIIHPSIMRIRTTGTISITDGLIAVAPLSLNAGGALTVGGRWNLSGNNALALKTTGTEAIAFNDNAVIMASPITMMQSAEFPRVAPADFSGSRPFIMRTGAPQQSVPWATGGTNIQRDITVDAGANDIILVDEVTGHSPIVGDTLDLGSSDLRLTTSGTIIFPANVTNIITTGDVKLDAGDIRGLGDNFTIVARNLSLCGTFDFGNNLVSFVVTEKLDFSENPAFIIPTYEEIINPNTPWAIDSVAFRGAANDSGGALAMMKVPTISATSKNFTIDVTLPSPSLSDDRN